MIKKKLTVKRERGAITCAFVLVWLQLSFQCSLSLTFSLFSYLKEREMIKLVMRKCTYGDAELDPTQPVSQAC